MIRGRAATVPAVAAALLLAALAGGCGGGSSGSADSEFVARGDAACAAAAKQIVALGAPRPESLTDYLEATDRIVARLRVKFEAIAGDEKAERAYVGGLAGSVKVLGEMVLAAQGQDLRTLRQLSAQLGELRVGRLAEAAGLGSCAKALVIRE